MLYLQSVMQDPVIAADGHTYEQHAVEQWLLHHTNSQVTCAELPHLRLVPNVTIRSAIRAQLEG